MKVTFTRQYERNTSATYEFDTSDFSVSQFLVWLEVTESEIIQVAGKPLGHGSAVANDGSEIFQIEAIGMELKGGRELFKIFGGQYQKFGVSVYEALDDTIKNFVRSKNGAKVAPSGGKWFAKKVGNKIVSMWKE